MGVDEYVRMRRLYIMVRELCSWFQSSEEKGWDPFNDLIRIFLCCLS